jgi:hypothetical protein
VRWLIVVAALAAAFAAAAGAAKLDPAALVLRQGDLPAGYRLDRAESGLRTNEIEGREHPELRAKFRAWGRVTGYQAAFEHGDAMVGSRADVFRSRVGPSNFLEWFVQELRKSTQLALQPVKAGLGDESLVYRWKLGGDNYTVVVWRFRGVFALVGAERMTRDRVLALARTQHRRIVAALR